MSTHLVCIFMVEILLSQLTKSKPKLKCKYLNYFTTLPTNQNALSRTKKFKSIGNRIIKKIINMYISP